VDLDRDVGVGVVIGMGEGVVVPSAPPLRVPVRVCARVGSAS
jgi:hypothetical protein